MGAVWTSVSYSCPEFFCAPFLYFDGFPYWSIQTNISQLFSSVGEQAYDFDYHSDAHGRDLNTEMSNMRWCPGEGIHRPVHKGDIWFSRGV